MPVVKREVDDIGRPSSTGHVPDSLAPTSQIMPSHPHPHPQQGPQPPPPSFPPFQDGQSRNMNYDNGPPVPPTPGGYRTSNFAPPTPISHQPQYDQPAAYSSQQESYYGVYNTNVSKKKNTRASQACDQCRQLKAKCDETKPCKTCRDKGTECRYRDPVPKAISTDKAQADILEGIQGIQSTLIELSNRFGRMDERVTKMEEKFRRNGGAPSVRRDPSYDDEYKSASATPEHRPRPHDEDSPPPHPVISTEAMPISMEVDDDMEVEPGPLVPPGEPAIPINHTTLASLLLDWDPIKELTRTHLEQAGVKYISEYPIGIEQVRGLLKVYGRGEDGKAARLLKDGGDHGSVDMADDVSDIASSSPAADWGQLGSLSPADQYVYQGGVLGSDGNPDFSESMVRYYAQSFKANMLNMHPIVQPSVIDEWVHHFFESMRAVPQKSARPIASKSAWAVESSYIEPATGKRKRSPNPEGAAGPSSSVSMRGGRPSRSIHSALVLLIVALGKICLHRECVPDVVYHPDPTPGAGAGANGSQESPSVHNGVPPSPIQGSPPGLASQSQHQQHTSGLPSPKEQQDRGSQSRRSSVHGSGSVRTFASMKKNYEVIPGLEYFALATDILGNHHGAYHNIKNVYANIFAGLYHGQLARPLESFSFIHKAGHTLQVIMRPSLDRLRKIKQNSGLPTDNKSNDITLAFWTCLQLESDLIAELPLPPSGLLQYEDDMPPPNMILLQGFDQRVLDSYPGQLYLRKHLNSIHRMFYSPDDRNRVESDKFKNVSLVSTAVSDMLWVASSFSFKETDGPATDILAARLRAKYWGAQVITYRPFVRQILQWSWDKEHHPGSPKIVLSEYRDGFAPHMPPSTSAPSDVPASIIKLAEKGINALIESTRAFHGLGRDRPIITNVFGTAHAQWGNMLVLTAAFKNTILNRFVDKALLKGLFEKTIFFLQQSATVTSSLKIDMLILNGLYKDLFLGGVDPNAVPGPTNGNAGAQTPNVSMAAPPSMPYMTTEMMGGMGQPSYPQMGHPHGH